MMRGSFLVNNSTGDVKIIAKILDNGDLSKGEKMTLLMNFLFM